MPTPADISCAMPSTIDHLVGQKQVAAQLRVALAAFWHDRAADRNPSFGNVLMAGPPGVGKTLCGHIIASELAGKLVVTTGMALSTGFEVYATLLDATDDSVLFIDEAQSLAVATQTLLLKAVDEHVLPIPRGLFSKHKLVSLSRFTLILGTTDEHQILPALRDRMRLVLRFSFYTVEELSTLCRQRAAALRWSAEPEIFDLIASRSKNVPRLTLRLLQSCYRTSRAENADIITAAHFHRTLELEGLDDELGLDKAERKYLAVLAESGLVPVRLNMLASRLGLPAQTLANVTEVYLVREGLVVRSDRGRQLTPRGLEYVRRNCGARRAEDQ